MIEETENYSSDKKEPVLFNTPDKKSNYFLASNIHHNSSASNQNLEENSSIIIKARMKNDSSENIAIREVLNSTNFQKTDSPSNSKKTILADFSNGSFGNLLPRKGLALNNEISFQHLLTASELENIQQFHKQDSTLEKDGEPKNAFCKNDDVKEVDDNLISISTKNSKLKELVQSSSNDDNTFLNNLPKSYIIKEIPEEDRTLPEIVDDYTQIQNTNILESKNDMLIKVDSINTMQMSIETEGSKNTYNEPTSNLRIDLDFSKKKIENENLKSESEKDEYLNIQTPIEHGKMQQEIKPSSELKSDSNHDSSFILHNHKNLEVNLEGDMKNDVENIKKKFNSFQERANTSPSHDQNEINPFESSRDSSRDDVKAKEIRSKKLKNLEKLKDAALSKTKESIEENVNMSKDITNSKRSRSPTQESEKTSPQNSILKKKTKKKNDSHLISSENVQSSKKIKKRESKDKEISESPNKPQSIDTATQYEPPQVSREVQTDVQKEQSSFIIQNNSKLKPQKIELSDKEKEEKMWDFAENIGYKNNNVNYFSWAGSLKEEDFYKKLNSGIPSIEVETFKKEKSIPNENIHGINKSFDQFQNISEVPNLSNSIEHRKLILPLNDAPKPVNKNITNLSNDLTGKNMIISSNIQPQGMRPKRPHRPIMRKQVTPAYQSVSPNTIEKDSLISSNSTINRFKKTPTPISKRTSHNKKNDGKSSEKNIKHPTLTYKPDDSIEELERLLKEKPNQEDNTDNETETKSVLGKPVLNPKKGRNFLTKDRLNNKTPKKTEKIKPNEQTIQETNTVEDLEEKMLENSIQRINLLLIRKEQSVKPKNVGNQNHGNNPEIAPILLPRDRKSYRNLGIKQRDSSDEHGLLLRNRYNLAPLTAKNVPEHLPYLNSNRYRSISPSYSRNDHVQYNNSHIQPIAGVPHSQMYYYNYPQPFIHPSNQALLLNNNPQIHPPPNFYSHYQAHTLNNENLMGGYPVNLNPAQFQIHSGIQSARITPIFENQQGISPNDYGSKLSPGRNGYNEIVQVKHKPQMNDSNNLEIMNLENFRAPESRPTFKRQNREPNGRYKTPGKDLNNYDNRNFQNVYQTSTKKRDIIQSSGANPENTPGFGNSIIDINPKKTKDVSKSYQFGKKI